MQEGTNSLFILFFSWWYSFLPRRLYLAFSAAMITLTDLFSVKVLLPTLFSPWKRDIVSTENLALQEKFQVWMMNLASRFIGFLIKIFVLATYAVVMVVAVVAFTALFILWIAFPLAIIVLIIIGIMNLSGSN